MFFAACKILKKNRPKIQKRHCVFWLALPQKLVFIGAKGAFKKTIFGYLAKNRYLKVLRRGDPLGWQWVESLMGGGVNPPRPHPKSATETN